MIFPLYFAGLRIPDPSESGYILKPRAYQYTPPQTGGPVFTDIVQIDPDADWLMLTWFFTGLGTQSILAGFNMSQISDSYSYQLLNSGNYGLNVSIDGADPSTFPAPVFLPKSGALRLNFPSNVVGQTWSIIFDGVDLFKAP